MALTLKIYSPSEDLSNFLETEVDEDDDFLNSLPFAEITASYVVLKFDREEESFELKVSASNFDQTAKNLNEVLSLSPGALIENVEAYVNGELAEREEYSPAELLSNLIGLDNDINKLEIVHSGDDFFYGSELGNEDDNVNGYAGNDTFQGNGDENGDIFHGGPGVDTAIYRGPRSNYVVSSASNLWDPVNYTASLQGFTVKDTTGLDGLDQLVDVEVLKFADVNIDLQNFTPDNNQDESDSGMDDDPRKEEGEYDERDRDDKSVLEQGNYTLNVIVDLFGQVLYLKGLRETVTSTSHTVEYAGTTFNWSEVDSFVTTVTRDGSFTDEFAKEIADVYPSVAGISYSTAVALVGASAIDSVLIAVAGADGNYVG
jgi:hypothetical protein